MKKILLFLGLIFTATNVQAMTVNKEGNYVNAVGAIISSSEYEILDSVFNESTIQNLPQESVNYYLENIHNLEFDKKIVLTTNKIDKNGFVLEKNEAIITEDEISLYKNNDNYVVLSDNKIYNISNQNINSKIKNEEWQYSTDMKMIQMTYNPINYGSAYEIIVEVEWLDEPLIKQYDVLAVRWDESVSKNNVLDYIATQTAKNSAGNYLDSQNYYLDGTNMKRTTYGIGQSMNLFNSGHTFELSMRIDLENDVGDVVYATYQHARHSSANTLAISQAYTFSNSGLGNVLYYSNSTYRNYYDGMQGIRCHLGDKHID